MDLSLENSCKIFSNVHLILLLFCSDSCNSSQVQTMALWWRNFCRFHLDFCLPFETRFRKVFQTLGKSIEFSICQHFEVKWLFGNDFTLTTKTFKDFLKFIRLHFMNSHIWWLSHRLFMKPFQSIKPQQK